MTSPTQTPPAPVAAPRETVIYPIPSTSLTLTLILNEAQPLPYPAARALLARAATHVRTHCAAAGLVPGVFRYGADPEFGITGGIFVNELSWQDVLDVLAGLQGFYTERWGRGGGGEEGGCGVIFYVKDDAGRGELGDGYLEPRKEGGVGGDGGGEGEGEGLAE